MVNTVEKDVITAEPLKYTVENYMKLESSGSLFSHLTFSPLMFIHITPNAWGDIFCTYDFSKASISYLARCHFRLSLVRLHVESDELWCGIVENCEFTVLLE